MSRVTRLKKRNALKPKTHCWPIVYVIWQMKFAVSNEIKDTVSREFFVSQALSLFKSNHLRDRSDHSQRRQSKDEHNLEKIIGERDQLRSAIGKLAQLRQHEMESQKDFRIQRDEQHEMMQKFNNLMIDNKRLVADNDHKSSQLKQVSLSRNS